MNDYEFQFVAGRLCLDFVNTLGDRGDERPSEHLTEYEELVRWAREGGAVDGPTADGLLRRARSEPPAASRVLQRARRARETLYRVFTAIREGKPPAGDDLGLLNEELGSALANLRIEPRDDGEYDFTWSRAPALDRPLWPVLRSAADLLASGDKTRIKACASHSCEWVFMDESRNRSRQWCQMEVCGNRAKARRHYARTKAGKRRGSGGHAR